MVEAGHPAAGKRQRPTACSAERNWSKWGLVYVQNRGKLQRRKAEKMIFLTDYSGVDGDDRDMLGLSDV